MEYRCEYPKIGLLLWLKWNSIGCRLTNQNDLSIDIYLIIDFKSKEIRLFLSFRRDSVLQLIIESKIGFTHTPILSIDIHAAIDI